MKKEMLINVSQAEECRIAILEDGRLEELYTERASQDNWVGNIYRGRIVNIEPSIQAAFVDFGVGRNGFLHISDVEPQYFRQAGYDPAEIAAAEFEEQRSGGGGRTNASFDDDDSDEGGDGDRRDAGVSAEGERRPRGGRGRGRGESMGRGESAGRGDVGGPDNSESGRSPRPRRPRPTRDGGFQDSFELPGIDDDADQFLTRRNAFEDPISEVSESPRGGRSRGDRGPERAERFERSERSERPERSDRFDRSDRPERDRLDRPDRPERSERSERSDRGGRRDGRQRSGGGGRRNNALLRSGRPRFKPPIQEVFKRGDEVLVQVIKEGIGTKGPTLSTYISIPGRYVVLMPALSRVGISRKIEDDRARRKLKDYIREIQPPKGVGFIIRTAGADRTAGDLRRDMTYLVRVWQMIVKRLQASRDVGLVFQESDMLIRTIRDNFTSDIDKVVIDQPDAYSRAVDFMRVTMPKLVSRLHLYDAPEPLFHYYKLEDEITRIHQRVVPLPAGGSLVIDQTEALVAIDVNSGNFRTDQSPEESALQLNVAAAKEIARQLRLRDLGGVIVNDFIDMHKEANRRKVERTLMDATRRDRAKTKILRTSPFGLIEMTRQRIRPSFKKSVYEDCPCCKGRGVVKTAESMAIEVFRILLLASQTPGAERIAIRVNENVAAYLNNRKRRDLMKIEEQSGLTLAILGSESQFPEQCTIEVRDRLGNLVNTPLIQSLQMV